MLQETMDYPYIDKSDKHPRYHTFRTPAFVKDLADFLGHLVTIPDTLVKANADAELINIGKLTVYIRPHYNGGGSWFWKFTCEYDGHEGYNLRRLYDLPAFIIGNVSMDKPVDQIARDLKRRIIDKNMSVLQAYIGMQKTHDLKGMDLKILEGSLKQRYPTLTTGRTEQKIAFGSSEPHYMRGHWYPETGMSIERLYNIPRDKALRIFDIILGVD